MSDQWQREVDALNAELKRAEFRAKLATSQTEAALAAAAKPHPAEAELAEVRAELEVARAAAVKPYPAWQILREAANLLAVDGQDINLARRLRWIRDTADRLEAEHTAQADADALIEKAAKAMFGMENREPWSQCHPGAAETWRGYARALLAAGLLREEVES